MLNLSSLLQYFFTERLCTQMQASPNTIAGYRDTFRLLLRYASSQLGKQPTVLSLEDIDANLIGNFLLHIEENRSNSARSRNARLAGIRSFFRYVAYNEPAYLLHCQKILTMPSKRYDRSAVAFLDGKEMAALLAAPDRSSWVGRRDHALILLALQTGFRASELINLTLNDLSLEAGAYVCCKGKGRKERATPLQRGTVKVLKEWIRELKGDPASPLFPTIRAGTLSRDALEALIKRHTSTAANICPSLRHKKVTPHVLRHSTAMNLLQHGVDQAVIALWLGHESVETTQIYIHADLALKEKALARVAAPKTKSPRFKPDDKLMAFLESL